jgi:MFS family permease
MRRCSNVGETLRGATGERALRNPPERKAGFMFQVLSGVWALLVGIVLIMLGNGMHFTLIGLRGDIEAFSAAELAVVTSGYFMGFLSGARFTPALIRRVGHVRVFAALGSFMSAGLISFPLLTDPWAWTVLRLLVGFCMSGIYVAAESWLNDASTNETRGKVLSAYMLAQTLGIIGAQGLLTLGDAGTSVLFIGASILVSISFAPILLSVSPVPAVEVARPMRLRDLFRGSPLGTVGIFLLGGVYATQSGMGAVFGAQIGMAASQIALFVAMLFAGALVLQYPIGWLSDRVDRRKLILGSALLGAGACGLGWLAGGEIWALMAAAFFAGGVTTPLYALLLAYTNDFLSSEDMPAASGGLVFTFGLGAIVGPLAVGGAMEDLGPRAFWLVLGGTFAIMALYALYRMTQRSSASVAEAESYLGVLPTASPVAVEAAGVWAAENAEAEAEAAAEAAPADAEGDADAAAPDAPPRGGS